MASRPIVLSFVLAADLIHGAAAAIAFSPSSSSRRLRGNARATDSASANGGDGDIPDIVVDARSLQGSSKDVTDVVDAIVVVENVTSVVENMTIVEGQATAIERNATLVEESTTAAVKENITAVVEENTTTVDVPAQPTTTTPTTTFSPTLAPATSPPTIDPTVSISPTLSPSKGPTTGPTPSPTAEVTVQIPTNCLNLLAASANENGKLKKENYFVFTDGMSNGYYVANNMTEYSDLPLENKFAYVTLTCQCHAFGGKGDCCQGDRARLDVAGIDDPESLSAPMQIHINDICSLTSDTIGDNVLDPSGELPTTSRPTSLPPTTAAPATSPPTFGPTRPLTVAPSREPTVQPSASVEPTASPFVGVPSLVTSPGGIGDSAKRPGGLGPGAWAGVAIASVAVSTLLFYFCFALVSRRKEKHFAEDEDDASVKGEKVRGREMVIRNMDHRISPATTSSLMTADDMGSIVSYNRSGSGCALNNLSAIEEGVSVRSPGSVTNMSTASTRLINNANHTLTATGISEGPNDSIRTLHSGNREVAAATGACAAQNDYSALSLSTRAVHRGKSTKGIQGGTWEAMGAASNATSAQSASSALSLSTRAVRRGKCNVSIASSVRSADRTLAATGICKGPSESLDRAVRSGDWEAVATSASGHNESALSSIVQDVD